MDVPFEAADNDLLCADVPSELASNVREGVDNDSTRANHPRARASLVRADAMNSIVGDGISDTRRLTGFAV